MRVVTAACSRAERRSKAASYWSTLACICAFCFFSSARLAVAVALASSASARAASASCCARGGEGDDVLGVVGDHVQRRHLLDEVVGGVAGQEGGDAGLLAGVAGVGDRAQLRLERGERRLGAGGGLRGGLGRDALGAHGVLGGVHLLADRR